MSRIPHALALTTAALLLSGCASGAQAEPSPEEETTAAASVSPSAAATTSPELEALATLETAAEEPAGFTEAAFGPALAGTDATGCDTFNAVLNRDLDGVTHDPRGDDTCTVFHGRLIDPYLDEIDNIVEYSNNQMRRDNGETFDVSVGRFYLKTEQQAAVTRGKRE